MHCRSILISAFMIAGCRASRSQPDTAREVAGSRYLFVWAGDVDKRESDFLAVVDVDRRSPTYAQVVTTLPVGAVGTRVTGQPRNRATGALEVDTSVYFGRDQWPHGITGPAVPHGAVFARP